MVVASIFSTVSRAISAALTGFAGLALIVALTSAASDPAAAARVKRQSATKAEVAALPPKPARRASLPSVPHVVVVSLRAQSLAIYSGTTVVAHAPVSSGMSGYATPTGIFSIIQKSRDHESNIYDNAPMPFMQRLTWSGVALHAGRLPGYPASHGCVRMPYDFAERLFGMLKMGTRVVVTPDVVKPETIAHANLPAPIFTAAAALAALPVQRGLQLASSGDTQTDATAPVMLNPLQAAEAAKLQAHAAAVSAMGEARRLLDEANGVVVSLADARKERIEVEGEIAGYLTRLKSMRDQPAVTDDEQAAQVEASMAALEDAITDASRHVEILRNRESVLSEQSFQAARAARDAEDAAERAEAALRMANRGGDPITVFVSRAEKRVQVRQGFNTILEGDVDIVDPQSPLGTHVLTAAEGGPESLSWTAVSIANGAIGRLSTQHALSRLTIEPKLQQEIGRRLWHGASMVISDLPASHETGKGTDFVLLTK